MDVDRAHVGGGTKFSRLTLLVNVMTSTLPGSVPSCTMRATRAVTTRVLPLRAGTGGRGDRGGPPVKVELRDRIHHSAPGRAQTQAPTLVYTLRDKPPATPTPTVSAASLPPR